MPQSDIVQGYELDDGKYVLFEPDELDKLKLTTRHTVELTEFVEACSIDPLYFDNPYYVLPDGDVAEEGYRIIRDALRSTKKYGVGQLTMRGRENLIAMKPCGEGLMIETLRYESEVQRCRRDLRRDRQRQAASGTDRHGEATDRRADARVRSERLQKSLCGSVAQTRERQGRRRRIDGSRRRRRSAAGGTVIDFMEALRRSTEKSGSKPAAQSKAKTAASRQKREPVKRAPAKTPKRKSRARG